MSLHSVCFRELEKEEKSYTSTITKGIFNCCLKSTVWRPFKSCFELRILLKYSNEGSMDNKRSDNNSSTSFLFFFRGRSLFYDLNPKPLQPIPTWAIDALQGTFSIDEAI